MPQPPLLAPSAAKATLLAKNTLEKETTIVHIFFIIFSFSALSELILASARSLLLSPRQNLYSQCKLIN
tara:strand:- start:58 stop:264 length:207 start_codon:yes stop_codon:yes gene_type:complete